jgi:hypothetical protein
MEEATANLAATSGQSIDELDPDSSLRTALSALAGVAALRPNFDVMVALPGASFALRVQHVDDQVEIEVLQRDGPAETSAGLTAAGSAAQPAAALPEQRPEPDPELGDEDGAQVASDLAAMLWMDVQQPGS